MLGTLESSDDLWQPQSGKNAKRCQHYTVEMFTVASTPHFIIVIEYTRLIKPVQENPDGPSHLL